MKNMLRMIKTANLPLMALFCLSAVLIYCSYTYRDSQKIQLAKIDERLYQAAVGTRFLIKAYPDLTPGLSQISEQAFKDLSFDLSEFARDAQVEYVYSLEQYNGNIVFTSSSFSEEDLQNDLLTQHMDVYEDATDLLKSTFHSNKVQFENSKDDWGEFRSVLLPVIDERGNTMVIGADIRLSEIDELAATSFKKALLTAGYFLGLSMLMAIFYVYKMQARLTMDHATGFANHVALTERLKHKDQLNMLAVVGCKDLIDISSFYGQHTLDLCIKQMLVNISEKLGSQFQYFRVSYNKVAVLAPASLALEEFTEKMEWLNSNSPLLTNPVIYTQFQIGIAKGPNKEVLENALLAEATARTEQLPIQCYSHVLKKLKSRYQENVMMSGMITEAFEQSRFVPYFQPIVDVDCGEVVKYEALARLKGQDGSLIPPYKFIPVINKSRLDQKLVKTMFSQCRDRFNQTTICWSINLSAQDMMDPYLSRWLLEELEQYSNPRNITFELLETEGIDNYAHMKIFIDKYRQLGAKVFIDDFGVGYSNISHFLKLNVDGLKLDGSLVERILTDHEVHLFIEYIVQFANAVGIEVVAEYIENEQILAAIKKLGVHYAQGYFFSAPVADVSPIQKFALTC